jgi:hypothetical protein
MRTLLPLLLIFTFISLPCHSSPIIIHTLPKSGSHLIYAILKQLPVEFEICHLTDHRGNPYQYQARIAVNVRDLRDYFVSLKHFTNTCVNWGLANGKEWTGFKPIHTYAAWIAMSEEEKLLALITLDSRIPYFEQNIVNNIAYADACFSNPSSLITRYEDWIGDYGGGSEAAYLDTIHRLLRFFNYSIPDALLLNAYEKSWGNSITFRKGQIGDWKSEFNEKHKEAFKRLWNVYLIHWGYEIDKNW